MKVLARRGIHAGQRLILGSEFSRLLASGCLGPFECPDIRTLHRSDRPEAWLLDHPRLFQARFDLFTEASPWNGSQALRRNRFPGFLAGAIGAREYSPDGFLHFVQDILIGGEPAQREVMIELIGGTVRDVQAVRLQWLRGFPELLASLLQKPVVYLE
jgi:hypothetical protein